MTLPEVYRLFSFWQHTPPLRDLVMIIASAVGYEPPEHVSPTKTATPAAQIGAMPEFED